MDKGIERKISAEDEIKERIKLEWEYFYKEVKKCEDCKIQRGNKEIIQPKDYCEYHQEFYRDMEDCVI